ncbi:hypothetical protein C815_02114 [Firmicutes bacterium M10-2]|nr:hypothetical protein C815_02114 [Firmicutes bacterium M10-2]
MSYSVLKFLIFLVCFGASFYACSAVQFEKFMKVHQPRKVVVMLFLISLALAYLTSQAVLELTIYNGFGG